MINEIADERLAHDGDGPFPLADGHVRLIKKRAKSKKILREVSSYLATIGIQVA